MRRRILFRTVIAMLSAAAVACLNDAPSGPSAARGSVGLRISARLDAMREDRTVTIRVFYRQQDEDEVDLPSSPESVRVPSGTTTQQPVTVTVTRCLEDPERERDEGGASGCVLYVELELLGADGVLLSSQTQSAGPSEPGETVDVPEFDLPQAAIELSEESLSFSAEEAKALPTAQTVIVGSATGAPLGSISVSIAAASSWLKATISEGQFTLQPTTTTLAPGTHTATVTVHSSRAGIESRSMTVTYTILARPQTLTITGAGSGDGRVTSEPAGIACTITAGTASGACSAPFSLNSTVRLTAVATNGSFTEWSGACTGGGTCQLTMVEARGVTARFTAPPQRLLVTLAGNGTGTVTSSPPGISCATTQLGGNGATCGELYAFGTQVTLTATPSGGSTFSGWSGACAGTGACTVTVDQARSVTATFTAPGRTVTVTGAGSGSGRVTSEPSGIDCAINAGNPSGACNTTFGYGVQVTLTAAASSGTFTGWSGDCSGTGTCQVNTVESRSVSAEFTAPPQSLTAVLTGSGTGTVVSSPSGISCGLSQLGSAGTSCGAQFAYGTQVTLTASPSGGSTFAGWSGGACSGVATCTVTVDQARSVTATFTAPPQALSVAGAGSGTGRVKSDPAGIDCVVTAGDASGSCSASFAYGANVILTATASNGSFTSWSGACSGGEACQLTMNQSRSVTATFTAPPQKLTVTLGGNGSGAVTSSPAGISCVQTKLGGDGVTCSGEFAYGTNVTLTAQPSGESSFDGWGGACDDVETCTVTMVQARSVTATFSAPAQSLGVVIAGPAGRVVSSPEGIDCQVGGEGPSSACDAQFPFATRVVLTHQSVDGTEFVGWEGACAGSGECAVTMDQARNVTARFRHPPQTLTVAGAGTGTGTVVSDPAGIACTIEGGRTSGACRADFAFGASVTLTAQATGGGSFDGWSGDCEGTGTCSVTMDAPRGVTATFKGPPPPGRDIVVFNDVNTFDNTAMATNANNAQLTRNLINFSAEGPRAAGSVVQIDCGRQAVVPAYCTTNVTTFRQTISDAGYTILDTRSSSGTLTSVRSDVKVLFLLLGCESFTVAEVNALKQFASEGGRIIYVGENEAAYAACFAVENQFLAAMGAKMTNSGAAVDCGRYVTLPQTSLREHQIMSGLTSLTIACASVLVPGPQDFPLHYDSTNTTVLAAVARIDVTPISAAAAASIESVRASTRASLSARVQPQQVTPDMLIGRQPQ